MGFACFRQGTNILPPLPAGSMVSADLILALIVGHRGNKAMRRADSLIKIVHFLRGWLLGVTAKKSCKSLKDAPALFIWIFRF
tara:strand:- start:297 stop:545 length:249 start_codon:yes stop_codon:yes gene_type:complete